GNQSVNAEVEPDGEIVRREDVLDYLKNKRALQREMDRRRKKRDSSHKRRKDRAGSQPMSDELAKLIQKVAEGDRKKYKYKPAEKSSKTKDDRRGAMKPITQVTAKSSLGRAFERLGKRMRHDSSDDPDDSDPSSDSSDPDYSDSDSEDSSDSSSSDSESSGYDSDRGHHGSRRHRRRQGRSRRRSRQRGRKTLIKPTPPESYDGRVDIRAFQKFLTHGRAYVTYGLVERKRQVM
ncbi:hypothetical protein H0H93_015565, partial [Arthromyces matolae]